LSNNLKSDNQTICFVVNSPLPQMFNPLTAKWLNIESYTGAPSRKVRAWDYFRYSTQMV